MSRLYASRRLLHIALLVAFIIFLAIAENSWVPAVALLPIAGLLFFALLEVLLPLPLVGQRDVEFGARMLMGDEARVEVTVQPAQAPFNLQLQDTLPEGFAPVPNRQEPFRPTPYLTAASASYSVKARRRGDWVIGPPVVKRVSALGLFERSTELPVLTTVTVLPSSARQLGVRVRPRPPTRQGQPTMSLRRGPGDEFFALRQYLPGDSIGDVNWKATARMNRIITNEFLPDEPPRYLLYVDTRAAGAEAGQEDVFERTLELTSILVEALIEARAHVGLVLISYHSLFQVPSGGASQLRRLRQMVLDCRPGYDAPIHELVVAGVPHLPARAEALLITPNVYDASLAQALTFLRTRHRRVSLLATGFPEPEGLELDPISQRAAGALLNAEQGAALEGLRRYVDQVAQWPPGEPIGVTIGRLGMTRRLR